jgi:hypothetical protein
MPVWEEIEDILSVRHAQAGSSQWMHLCKDACEVVAAHIEAHDSVKACSSQRIKMRGRGACSTRAATA